MPTAYREPVVVGLRVTFAAIREKVRPTSATPNLATADSTQSTVDSEAKTKTQEADANDTDDDEGDEDDTEAQSTMSRLLANYWARLPTTLDIWHQKIAAKQRVNITEIRNQAKAKTKSRLKAPRNSEKQKVE